MLNDAKTDGPSSGDHRGDGDGYAHETSAAFGSCIVCARWRVVRARARRRTEHRDRDDHRLQCGVCHGTLTSEQLVSAYLKRIEAYDKQGPAINAIITLNKKALDEARQLDAERKSGKVRGPLHGIPVVLKDNYDTVDMPTTAGSQLLEGH